MVRAGIRSLLAKNEELEIVGEAASGTETIDIYNSLNPDLLIMDISMPNKNGMEVAEELLSADPEARIIILSMYDDEEYINKCIELGVRGYVIKSESSDELEYAIKSALNDKLYFSNQAQKVIFSKYAIRKSDGQRKERNTYQLTAREKEVIKLISEGMTSNQMAEKLIISPRTVETHRAKVMKKLGVKNVVELLKEIEKSNIL